MKNLSVGDTGKFVANLQIILAGFRGTIPDGIFGPGTALQVSEFQKEYMLIPLPSGVVDNKTWLSIKEFSERYKVNFEKLQCPCGECDGFGNGLYKHNYRNGKAQLEKYYLYEYPGIHIMLIWAVMGLQHLTSFVPTFPTSGYRCSIRNKQTNRTSTNHHGKAIDLDFDRSKFAPHIKSSASELIKIDRHICNKIRSIAVEKSNAQVGWYGKNRKSLEPSYIAPTWVHYDVRRYERQYLHDSYFVKNTDHVLQSVGL